MIRFNGRRGIALVALSLGLAAPRGLSYLPPLSATDAPRAVQLLSQWIPYETWGVVWLLAAVVGLVSAFRIESRSIERALDRDAFAFGALIALTGAWGLAYTASAILTAVGGGESREWVLAGTFLGAGVALWAMVAPKPIAPPLPLTEAESRAEAEERADDA